MIKQKKKNKRKKNQCIVDGTVYTLNVKCILDNGLIGTSSITIGTNNPPFGGYCYFKQYNKYSVNDIIIIEIDTMEYQTELTVICTNWNDEHMPLTQNIKMIYPTLIQSCLSYQISTASSFDWNKCKGTYLAEFEQSNNHLILGLGQYLLIAVIRDSLNYDAVYKLPMIQIIHPSLDLNDQTLSPTSKPTTISTTSYISTITTDKPTTDTPTTSIPSISPITSPTNTPTLNPSNYPTFNPTNTPTTAPTGSPIIIPTTSNPTSSHMVNTPTPLALSIENDTSIPSMINTPTPRPSTIQTTTPRPTNIVKVPNTPNVPTVTPSQCNQTIITRIEWNVNRIVNDLDYMSQQLTQTGDTQIYFQVLQSMNNALDYFLKHYGECLSLEIKRLIFDTKIRIIQLTKNIMNDNSTTKTYDNLQNQLNTISSVLDLFCTGSDAYDADNNCNTTSPLDNQVMDSEDTILTTNKNGDYSQCITTSDIISESSQTLQLLSEYFTENASSVLFELVDELVTDILMLDEFKEDVLDETMSDALIDIISSIHIWFIFNLGANSKYGDLENITDLIQLITQATLSNSTNIMNENSYWSSCWMDIDISWVQLTNMSKCDGYSSNIVWPNNITNYLDDIYDILSTVNCLVTEIIYNDELLLNIELKDDGDTVNVSLRDNDNNTTNNDMCDGIEFTICNTEKVYTLINDYNHSLLSNYNIPICEWSLLDTDKDANNTWNTSGCYVSSYTSSCVVCKCMHLTLFKADSDEFKPEINIVTKSSFKDINGKHIGDNPGPLLFVLLSSVLFISLWMISLKYCKRRDCKPLVAVPDIVNKSVRRQMMNESGYALSLIEIYRKDIGFGAKICNVFILYMKDYHTILSIFTSTKHTNYSVTQRIFCCFMYIMTICTVSALFYGQQKETVVGSLVLMIWASLLTCIPIYIIIYMFQFSRPNERDSEIKIAIVNAKVFNAPCHQLSDSEISQLSLELCAKWLISEMASTNNNCNKGEQERMIHIERASIPMIYPDQSAENSLDDSQIPDLPRPPAKSITAPPPAPLKRIVFPPPRPSSNEMENNPSISISNQQQQHQHQPQQQQQEHEDEVEIEVDLIAQQLLDEHTPLAVPMMANDDDNMADTDDDMPPWCRAPPAWDPPNKPSLNAPKPMIQEHHNHNHRKSSYDVVRRHMSDDNDNDNDNDDNDDDEKLEELPRMEGRRKRKNSNSKKKRILMNAYGIVESEIVRKRILRKEYPLPHFMKKVAWFLLIIWTLLSMILIVIYGAHFDLIYNSCVTTNGDDKNDYYKCYEYSNALDEYDMNGGNKRLLLNDNDDICYWKNSLNDRVYDEIVEYIEDIINSDNFDLNGIPDHDDKLLVDVGIDNDGETDDILTGDVINNRLDIYGANITDSDKWITSCFVTLLIGFIIWQPIWLYLIAILYTLIPSCGTLKCTQIICPWCFTYFKRFDEREDDKQSILSKKLHLKQIDDKSSSLELEINKKNIIRNKLSLKPKNAVRSNSIRSNKQKENMMMVRNSSFSPKLESSHSDRNKKRIQREQELSEHYKENSKILENTKPTILSHAMISLQQRQSGTFDESTMSHNFSSGIEVNKNKLNEPRRSAIYDDGIDEKLEEKEEEENMTTDDSQENSDANSKSSDLFGIGDDDIIYFEHANNRHHRGGNEIFSFKEFIIDENHNLSIDTKQFISDLQH